MVSDIPPIGTVVPMGGHQNGSGQPQAGITDPTGETPEIPGDIYKLKMPMTPMMIR